jgi:hypothetical protein
LKKEIERKVKKMKHKKPSHTVRIKEEDFQFTDQGVFIKQGAKIYSAEPVEVNGEEYFVVNSDLTGKKIWIEVVFD